jgi:hypothetical protein
MAERRDGQGQRLRENDGVSTGVMIHSVSFG